MTGMPYVVQAGSILNGIANYWEDQKPIPKGSAGAPGPLGRDRMVRALESCLNPNLSFIDSNGFPPRTNLERDHIWEHWLGYTPPYGAGVAVVKPGPTTGWWQGWKGDADRILKATFARGLQVALGYTIAQDGAYVAAHPTQRWWPIDILWVCGSPLFQGYVEWRERLSGVGAHRGGHVTIILATPPIPLPLNSTPVSFQKGLLDYAEGAAVRLDGEQGIVVIGQPKTFNKTAYVEADEAATPEPDIYSEATAILPKYAGALYWTTDDAGQDTITVSMSEDDGGILTNGRRP